MTKHVCILLQTGIKHTAPKTNMEPPKLVVWVDVSPFPRVLKSQVPTSNISFWVCMGVYCWNKSGELVALPEVAYQLAN